MTFPVFFSMFVFAFAIGFWLWSFSCPFLLYFPSRWTTRDTSFPPISSPCSFDTLVRFGRVRNSIWFLGLRIVVIVALVDAADSSVRDSCSCSAAANGVITQQQHGAKLWRGASPEMGEWVNAWMPSLFPDSSSYATPPAASVSPPVSPLSLSLSLGQPTLESEWAVGVIVAFRCHCCCGYV